MSQKFSVWFVLNVQRSQPMVAAVMQLPLFILLIIPTGLAYVHNQILKSNTPRSCDCIPWLNKTSSSKIWADSSLIFEAGSYCALPANAIIPEDPALTQYSPAAGWCYCNPSSPNNLHKDWYTWCDSPKAVPSQINLLAVNASSVVVNFVTNDGGIRAASEVTAELRVSGTHNTIGTFKGYSSLYVGSTSSHRALSYHHVTLHSLSERRLYEYRVRVGGTQGAEASLTSSSKPSNDRITTTASEWSEWLQFRSLYKSGPTRFAAYADMGNLNNPNSPK